ncbi:MAG: N-acetylmuramoyl-L-alanine amidase [Clostridium sp.]
MQSGRKISEGAEKERCFGSPLTRTDDTKIPLEECTAMANEKEADLFVSIHCNYCEG